MPSSKQVSFAAPPGSHALEVVCKPGADEYPGITIIPPKPWDFSGKGHIAAKVSNRGSTPIDVIARVDNDGNWQDNPFNSESIHLDPGASGVLTVIFGYSYGHQNGFKLNPAAVVRMLFFTRKSDKTRQVFQIESIEAAGAAGEIPPAQVSSPDDLRLAPAGGDLFDTKGKPQAALHLTTTDGGARCELADNKVLVRLDPATAERTASVGPTAGRWDLRQYLQVAVRVANRGEAPVLPRVRLDSNTGSTDWIGPGAPIAPGSAVDLVIPFASKAIWDGSDAAGDQFVSDAVSRLTLSVEHAEKPVALAIESAVASLPTKPIPDWVGKRPPVEGDWKQTFDEEFNGSQVDSSKWDLVGENYYDKVSHFSKANVLVGNGVARLHFERKRGSQNDDPARHPQTDYATGYLTTTGKWAQRYGYFESRMRLPRAPGLWPAFWMMPDRGATAPADTRGTTFDGGMEFDILEHLDRWGPYRYNIAMHWDGYESRHKSVGSERVYFQPDADGFVTAGMLWTPGSLVFYANGTPVLKWTNPRVASVPAAFLFTLPSGGWDNDAIDDKKLPDDLIIDYVRVWQRADLEQPAGR